MRRLLYLAALSLVATLLFAPAALAQTAEWRADQIAAAVESGQMTQQEACADSAYLQVYPKNCASAQAAPTQQYAATDQYHAPVDQYAAADQYAALADDATAALPASGGPALLLSAGVLLLGAGLLGMKLTRRS